MVQPDNLESAPPACDIDDDGASAYDHGPTFYAGSQFKKDGVFAEELKTIRDARAKRGQPVPAADPDEAPDVGHELAGLALSGGGIRSATFALGAVQALNENRIFDKLDYLSTVSGGGYFGACISCLTAQGRELPFGHRLGRLEHTAFRHLRNHANYLAPGGTGKILRIPALMLQGMVRNFFAVLPFIFFTTVAALWLYGSSMERIKNDLSGAEDGFPLVPYQPIVVGAFLMLVWMLVVAPLIEAFWPTRAVGRGRETRQTPREIRETLLKWSARLLALALVATFLSLQPYAIWLFTQVRYGLPILTMLSGLGVALVATALVRRAIDRIVGPFAEKSLILILAILGPLTLWLVFLLLSSWAISPPVAVFDLFSSFGIDYRGAVFRQGMLTDYLPVRPLVATPSFTKMALSAYAGAGLLLLFVFITVYDVNAASVHTFYRDKLSRAFLFTYADDDAFKDTDPILKPYDHIKLSELSDDRPLHLINSAINIQSSRSRNMRGRNADFFVFSRLFTGGEYTGYCPTADLEQRDPRLDLAAAMAISGAALSPNAGRHTNRALRFLLMLVNVRLGYWLHNPKHVAREVREQHRGEALRERLRRQALERAIPGQGWRLKSGVSPYYLFLEATGSLHENRDYIYVTDGGHIDNLGAFELLRRRCRYIIVCDAEADPRMRFEGLAHLIRLARIDLGIDIEIDVTDLRKSALGVVRAHCALGKINYSRSQVGHLLYIKASLTGDENEYISEYRARNPDFPHETTADQFFNEAQFEAYRALGHHIVGGLFETRRSESRIEMLDQKPLIYASADEWFTDLGRWLRPQPANLEEFLELQREAAVLERRMSEPAFAAYSRQIYQEYRQIWSAEDVACDPGELPPPVDERILHLVNDQLLLMERAVLRLRLDDPRNWLRPSNRGFMNSFRRWSQADLFRMAWAVCIFEYSPDLQRFCRDALKLRHTIEWRPGKQADLNAYERRYVEGCRADEVHAAYLSVPNARSSPDPGRRWGRFMVAIAIVKRDGGRRVLQCLRIRDTYRRQGLSLALAKELRAELGDRKNGSPLYRLGQLDPKVEASMRQIFERAGFVDAGRAAPLARPYGRGRSGAPQRRSRRAEAIGDGIAEGRSGLPT